MGNALVSLHVLITAAALATLAGASASTTPSGPSEASSKAFIIADAASSWSSDDGSQDTFSGDAHRMLWAAWRGRRHEGDAQAEAAEQGRSSPPVRRGGGGEDPQAAPRPADSTDLIAVVVVVADTQGVGGSGGAEGEASGAERRADCGDADSEDHEGRRHSSDEAPTGPTAAGQTTCPEERLDVVAVAEGVSVSGGTSPAEREDAGAASSAEAQQQHRHQTQQHQHQQEEEEEDHNSDDGAQADTSASRDHPHVPNAADAEEPAVGDSDDDASTTTSHDTHSDGDYEDEEALLAEVLVGLADDTRAQGHDGAEDVPCDGDEAAESAQDEGEQQNEHQSAAHGAATAAAGQQDEAADQEMGGSNCGISEAAAAGQERRVADVAPVCAEAEAEVEVVVVIQSDGVQDAHPNSRGTASLRQSRDDSNAADNRSGDGDRNGHVAAQSLGGVTASATCGSDRRVNRGTSPAEHLHAGAAIADLPDMEDMACAGEHSGDEVPIDASACGDHASAQHGECGAAAGETAVCDLDESVVRNDDSGDEDEDAQAALMAVVLAGLACNAHTACTAQLEQHAAEHNDESHDYVLVPEADQEECAHDAEHLLPEHGADRVATDGIGDVACLAELVHAAAAIQYRVGHIRGATPAVDTITWTSSAEPKHESGDEVTKSEPLEKVQRSDGDEAESARGGHLRPKTIVEAAAEAPEGAGESAHVLMSGKLRADGARKWRWAVLTGTEMKLFKSESEAASGRAARTLETRLGAARASRDGAPEVFTFFPNVGRSIKLRAKTSTEAAEWVRVLSACCSGMVLEAIQSARVEDAAHMEELPQETADPRLLPIIEMAGNDVCADCGEPKPCWASTNLGVLLCLKCSGAHRSLGTGVSKVRSLVMDTRCWDDAAVIATMLGVGNAASNARWEAGLASSGDTKPGPQTLLAERTRFIASKYAEGKYAYRDATVECLSRSLGLFVNTRRALLLTGPVLAVLGSEAITAAQSSGCVDMCEATLCTHCLFSDCWVLSTASRRGVAVYDLRDSSLALRKNRVGGFDVVVGKETLCAVAHDAGGHVEAAVGEAASRARVFGAALEHVLEADGRRSSGVPRAVEECAEYLRARGGLEREGIFRVSGSIGKMAALQAALDKRAPIDAGEYGPCEVSQALKRLLARLPEPLMTHAGWLQLVGQCPAASRRRVRKVVAALPDPNKRLLRFLVEDVFLGVLAHTAVNKMTAESLSIVVAPCILRASDDALVAMRLTPEEHRDLANRVQGTRVGASLAAWLRARRRRLSAVESRALIAALARHCQCPLPLLDLSAVALAPQTLAYISGLAQLTELSVAGKPLTTPAMHAIGGLVGLRYLDISKTKVNDTGVKELAGLQRLQCLNCSDLPLTDSSASTLAKMESLAWLNLSRTKIGDAGVGALAAHPRVADLCLASTQVTPACAQSVASLALLVTADFRGTRLSPRDLQCIKKAIASQRGTTAVRVDGFRIVVGKEELRPYAPLRTSAGIHEVFKCIAAFPPDERTKSTASEVAVAA
eukprot:m51a1_g6949 hypothetical protein (1524) ;mRNA; r:14698-23684